MMGSGTPCATKRMMVRSRRDRNSPSRPPTGSRVVSGSFTQPGRQTHAVETLRLQNLATRSGPRRCLGSGCCGTDPTVATHLGSGLPFPLTVWRALLCYCCDAWRARFANSTRATKYFVRERRRKACLVYIQWNPPRLGVRPGVWVAVPKRQRTPNLTRSYGARKHFKTVSGPRA